MRVYAYTSSANIDSGIVRRMFEIEAYNRDDAIEKAEQACKAEGRSLIMSIRVMKADTIPERMRQEAARRAAEGA
jgi:hypothetical protein